ncbi:MAG: hypothetical protein ACHQZS_05280 [Candidatus Binatales bacterium]
MTVSTTGPTPTELIATASEALIAGGYLQIVGRFPEWDTATSRLFEDAYSVVGVVVFDTCGELLRAWPDLQGSLVEVISQHVGRAEAKSWDGYLVLLTPALAPSGKAEVEAVRYNTTRLRKIVATGDDLQTTADVERVLSSLLPFGQEGPKLSRWSALDLLPKLLADQGVPEETTAMLIGAFREQAPMLERLHSLRVKQ